MRDSANGLTTVDVLPNDTRYPYQTILAILYAVSSTVILIFLDVFARLDANDILSNYGKVTILTPIYYYVFLGIMFFVWWYPSFFFLWELHRGIMTPETYIREDFSCFCQ